MHHSSSTHRVLIIDDNVAIHEDIRKVLTGPVQPPSSLEALEDELFGDAPPPAEQRQLLEIDSAYQGQQGLALLERALQEEKPYSLAFVDVRMPPGWDGVETISHLWREDPRLQIVLCTAYSDHSWKEIVRRLGRNDGLLILKKPFEVIEIQQATQTLTLKWSLQRQLNAQLENLEQLVDERTQEMRQAHQQLQQEMVNRQQLEHSLRLAQKLEAIGRLSAGIAHEINTPVQYIGDSLYFIRSAYESLQPVLSQYRRTCQRLVGLPGYQEALQVIMEMEREVDGPYLQNEVPAAFDAIMDGLDRVRKIVQAMKEFSHPEVQEKAPVDLNRMLSNSLTIARHEYKHVAEVELALDPDLPPVCCLAGEIGQAFLNIIVNAAQAIAEIPDSHERKGLISVVSAREQDGVLVSVKDTGCGIPEEIRDKVFDLFFTTKQVGKGTGQGLAQAYAAVVKHHHGQLTFESRPGEGTTFFIRLPLGGNP